MLIYVPIALIALWLDPPLYFWVTFATCFFVDLVWGW